MVHHQLKFSSALALNFMCTYAVHILIYSTVTWILNQAEFYHSEALQSGNAACDILQP